MAVKITQEILDKKAEFTKEINSLKQKSGASIRSIERHTGLRRHQVKSILRGSNNYTIESYVAILVFLTHSNDQLL